MNLKPTYKGIIFDLDDTLYAERTYQLSGFLAVARWLEENRAIAGFYEVAAALFATGARQTIFNQALDQLGCPWDRPLITTLIGVFRAHKPAISLFEGVSELLGQLKKADLHTGLITDGYETAQTRKIEALGLGHQIDLIIVTDAYGRQNWKPAPFAYKKIMSAFGLRGEECVYIGDNPAKDFITARQLGWQTIRFKSRGGEHESVIAGAQHEADITLHSFDKLGKLLHLPQGATQRN